MTGKNFKLICLLVVLSVTVTSVAYAFVYETKTQTVTQTILKKWLSGYTSTGSTSYPTGTAGITSNLGSNAVAGGVLDAQKITIPAGGVTIKSVTMSFASTGGGDNINIAFYTDNSGSPGSLVSGSVTGATAVSAPVTTITYSTPFYLNGGTYWLAYQEQNNKATRYYDTSGSSSRAYRAYSWASFPSTYSATSIDNLRETIYTTYVQVEGYAKATKATLSTTANVRSMSFYSHATGNFRIAIYTDSSGPSSLKWQCSSTAATASAWNTVNINSGTPSSLTLSAGTYWLVWQWDSANSGPSYTAGNSGDGNYIALTYGSFPASWSGGTSSSEKWSIYVTYTS